METSKIQMNLYRFNKQNKALGQSFHDNWTSLLMLLGIAIPLLITIGPGAEALKAVASFGEAGVGAINIVLWVPIVVCLICFIVGRKKTTYNRRNKKTSFTKQISYMC